MLESFYLGVPQDAQGPGYILLVLPRRIGLRAIRFYPSREQLPVNSFVSVCGDADRGIEEIGHKKKASRL